MSGRQHPDHPADVEPGRGEQAAVGEQAAGVEAVVGEFAADQHPAVRQVARGAANGLDPAGVGQLGVHLRLPGARVHGQHQPVLLHPAQHGDQRPGAGAPVHVHQVGIGLPVPVHVHPAAVQVQQVQADRAGGPRGQHLTAVRGPPPAAGPAELPGRRVGHPPPHAAGVAPRPAAGLPGQQLVGAVRPDDPQAVGRGDVADQPPGRVRVRVEDVVVGVDLGDRGFDQVGPEQPAAADEGRHPGRLVHRERLDRPAGHPGLGGGGDVQHPELGGRVAGTRRAQKGHPRAVRADHDGVRRAVGEPAGASGELGEVHADQHR
jgi:hypothetical protein